MPRVRPALADGSIRGMSRMAVARALSSELPRRRVARGLMFAMLVLGLAACATVPYTGRRQLALVSDRDLRAEGEQLYGIMRRRAQIARDGQAIDLVRDVGRRIAAVSGEPTWQWEFTLFDDRKQVNAWALPGGKVGVYTGIFPVARDQAGLAVIMAHEVGHAIAHHSAERTSQGTLLGVLGEGLAIAAGAQYGATTAQLLMEAYGLGAQVGVLLPFSRAQESEADEIGLYLMAQAGYDPQAAIGVWERMGEAARGRAAPPEFLSTHPSDATRLDRIRAQIPKAMAHFRERGTPNQRLPALDQIALPPADETALLEAVDRLDALASDQRGARYVAQALGEEYGMSAKGVVELANRSSLTAGETALVLDLARRSGREVDRLVAEARNGRSWYDISRGAGISPAVVTAALRRLAGAPGR